MSGQSMSIPYEEALAAFDHAYAAFLAAFGQAPDEALGYVPPGDEYALGVLPPHLQEVLQRYTWVLQQMVQSDFAPVDRSLDTEQEANEAKLHAFLVTARPTGADRAPMLAELAAAHQAAMRQLAALDAATSTRAVPVIYSAGSAPYPTSARDILGWLSDHYQEHIAQIGSMLAQWQAEGHH
jgi:hypothetical protein